MSVKFNLSVGVLIILLMASACSTMPNAPKQNSSTEYVSKYDHKTDLVGNLNVRNYTKAPLRTVAMVHLNASPKDVFSAVLKDLDKWGPGIEAVSWNHEANISNGMGVGSFRQCTFKGDLLHEDIVYFEKNSIYAYKADMDKSNVNLPIKDHLGVFIVEDDGLGGSLVTWRIYFDGIVYGTGPLVSFMMNNMVVTKGMNNLVDLFGGTVL